MNILRPPSLRRGSRGQEVARIQRRLDIVADGIFGPATDQAVKYAQHCEGIPADGWVGPETRDALGLAVHWGVDLSHWQGDQVDYEALAAADCGFVFLKATQGTNYKWARWYLDNAMRVKAAGLALGAYHFAEPRESLPSAEASHFLEVVSYGPCVDLPLVLDMEERRLGNPHRMVNWCGAFLTDVGASSGDRPILYTGQSMIRHHFDKASVGELANCCDRWVPRYATEEKDVEVSPWPEWVLWQHTNNGRVPGVPTNCDVNWCAGGWLDRVMGRQ